MTHEIKWLPGVPVDHVMARLSRAGGGEVESGKINSPQSSAALAVNCFGWFAGRPGSLPPFPRVEAGYPASEVDVEFQARFPWRGGRHPWLDAVVITPTHLVGVESKRFEPFRDRKKAVLSDAYDRPVWGERMGPFEALRDVLRSGDLEYRHLDGAQLVKHGFGLVTEARRRNLTPVLVYLYAEPEERAGRPIDPRMIENHRHEIADFESRCVGAEVAVHSASYRTWIATWKDFGPAVAAHGQALLRAFQP